MAAPPDSILNTVKKTLGLAADYTAFDVELILHINSVLSDLNQIGVGPPSGFAIEDENQTWAQFLGALPDHLKHNNVKTYMNLRLRLIFDPPETSFGIASFQEQCNAFEWRIREAREEYAWAEPVAIP